MHIVEIDKSSLSGKHKLYEHDAKLDEFVHAVSLAKPLLNFVATDDLCKSVYRTFKTNDGEIDRRQCQLLTGVEVYQNGEKLGEVGIADIYRRNEGQVYVYTVSSFRIDKERGDYNRTYNKDMKVALRKVKEVMYPRIDEELIKAVKDTVSNRLCSVLNSARQAARWSMDTEDEALTYAMAAYKAILNQESTVTLPANLATVKASAQRYGEERDFMQIMEAYEQVRILHVDYAQKNRGHAVQLRIDGSYVVYTFGAGITDDILKYKSIDDLPKHLSDKVSALQLVNGDEAHSHIGIKFKSGNGEVETFYFLVDGDILFK